MAREYANIFTAIWRNKDFRGLSDSAQKLYFLLVTQPDITAAGTLPLTVARWASCAADTTPDSVRQALAVLSSTRFIAVDFDTEELLVRTFVRHDKGYGNRKRRPVILRAAEEITSERLSSVLREEFVALGLPVDGLSDALSEGVSTTSGGAVESEGEGPAGDAAAKVSVTPGSSTEDGLFSQVDRLSDRASGSPSDGTTRSDGVVGCLVSSSIPHPSTLIPAVSGDAASGDPKTKPKSKRAHRLPTSWEPNEAHRARAAEQGLDLARQVELFRLNADTNERTAKNWNAAFTTWLIKAPQYDRGGPVPTAAPVVNISDRATATAWLRDEWTAGRVSGIEKRTGLRYERPDLPDDVSGHEASMRWAAEHLRRWITDNHELIITRILARAAA